MDLKVWESEDLRAASTSATAQLGGLPDTDSIREQKQDQAVQMLSTAYGIPRDDVREWAEGHE